MLRVQPKLAVARRRAVYRPLPTQPALGLISSVIGTGEIYVRYPSSRPGPAGSARTAVPVSENDIGREVLLLFEGGDPLQPVITGILQPVKTATVKAKRFQVTSDDERVVIEADQ